MKAVVWRGKHDVHVEEVDVLKKGKPRYEIAEPIIRFLTPSCDRGGASGTAWIGREGVS